MGKDRENQLISNEKYLKDASPTTVYFELQNHGKYRQHRYLYHLDDFDEQKFENDSF